MSDIEWKVLKSNDDAERAQLNKILADIRRSLYGRGGGSAGPGTTSDSVVTRNFEDRLNAMAMAWRDTSARVLYYDNTIESIAQDITYLNARIDDIEVGGGDSEAIQTLTARVIATEEGIIANSQALTELNAAVFDPDTGETTWASAIEDLSVTVDGINDTVLAMYTLDLDANGYITGWKFTNDGTTGVVDFRADRFRITAPGSINSVEFADGVLMSETDTHSYYHGVNFGTDDNLITWYGPTPSSGADGANADNGLFWIKNDGSGYFGGGLSNTVVENLPIVQEIIVDISDLDGDVVTVVQQVNNLESAINDPVTGLSTRASISQLNEVKSRLDNTGGGLSIESVASTVNALNTSVNHPTTGLATKASNTRVSNAESRLDSVEGTLSSTASEVSFLSASIGRAVLVANGSFELGFEGWRGSGATVIETSEARHGTKALRIDANATIRNSVTFDVEPGDRVLLQAFVRSHSVAPNAGALYRIAIRWARADGTLIANHVGQKSYVAPGGAFPYQELGGEFTAPAEAANGHVFVWVTGHTSGYVIYDSISAELVSKTEQATASLLDSTRADVQQNADGITAASERMDRMQASVGQSVLLINPDFELEETGWQASAFTLDDPDAPLPPNVNIYRNAGALAHTGSCALRVAPRADGAATFIYNSNRFSAGPGDVVSGSIRFRTHYSSPPPAGTRVVWGVRWYAADNSGLPGVRALGEYTFSGSGNYFYGNAPLEGEVVAPEDTAYGRLVIFVSQEFTGAPGPLYFDAAQARRGGAIATASDLALVRTDVQQHGDTLTAHALRMDNQQTEIDGKASTSYVATVEGIATAAGNQASSNLSAINSLTSTVGGHTASINELREVSVSSAAGNAIINASFEKPGTGQGWGSNSDGTGVLPNGGYYFASAASRSGGTCFRFNSAANLNNAGLMAVPASRQIRVGFWSRHVGGAAPSSYIRFMVRGYDAQMNQVLFAAVGGSATRSGGGAYNIAWQKNEAVYTVPSDVVYIRGVLQTTTGDWSGNWMVDDVFMEPVSESLADIRARYSLAVTAGGDVAGMELLAGGGTSAIRFLTNSFEIVAPSGGARTTYSGGTWSVYDSSNKLRMRWGVW